MVGKIGSPQNLILTNRLKILSLTMQNQAAQNQTTPPQTTPPQTEPSQANKNRQLWYKNEMVLIFVIGLPLFVVVACIGLVIYSVKIGDTVVRDDWYMDGKTLYQDVSRDKLAHDLQIHGKMIFAKDGQINFYLDYPKDSVQSGKLKNGMPLTYPNQLKLSISHATDIKKDRDATLVYQGDNLYQTKVDLDPLPSKYYVEISHEDSPNWRIREVNKLPQTELFFKPLKNFE